MFHVAASDSAFKVHNSCPEKLAQHNETPRFLALWMDQTERPTPSVVHMHTGNMSSGGNFSSLGYADHKPFSYEIGINIMESNKLTFNEPCWSKCGQINCNIVDRVFNLLVYC